MEQPLTRFRYISLSVDNTNAVRLLIYRSSTFLSHRSRHSRVAMTFTGGRGAGEPGDHAGSHVTLSRYACPFQVMFFSQTATRTCEVK